MICKTSEQWAPQVPARQPMHVVSNEAPWTAEYFPGWEGMRGMRQIFLRGKTKRKIHHATRQEITRQDRSQDKQYFTLRYLQDIESAKRLLLYSNCLPQHNGQQIIDLRKANAAVLRTYSIPSHGLWCATSYNPSLPEKKLAGIPLYDTCRTRSRRGCCCWTVTPCIGTMYNK